MTRATLPLLLAAFLASGPTNASPTASTAFLPGVFSTGSLQLNVRRSNFMTAAHASWRPVLRRTSRSALLSNLRAQASSKPPPGGGQFPGGERPQQDPLGMGAEILPNDFFRVRAAVRGSIEEWVKRGELTSFDDLIKVLPPEASLAVRMSDLKLMHAAAFAGVSECIMNRLLEANKQDINAIM
ncbi:hypothetical protein T484DRAFT_1783172 [Baffinella frigidus]|nr:hypothetical protein T484DRAFT_1783172 [Cryptophyta sp. CCMP2293]